MEMHATWSRLKKSVCGWLAGVTALSIVLAVPGPAQVSASSNATINLSAEKQVIRGFGGINHPVWIGDLTKAQRETAFGKWGQPAGLFHPQNSCG